MVPNGHTATYIFFSSIIRLGLFQPKSNFLNEIHYFLYRQNQKQAENERVKKEALRPHSHHPRKTRTNKQRNRNKGNT